MYLLYHYKMQNDSWLDRIGATGSLLCAVHCAVGPLLIALLPTLGLSWSDPRLEFSIATFVTILGLGSVYLGWRRHGATRALSFMLPGLTLIWLTLLWPFLHENLVRHAAVMAMGGTLVAAAHLINLKLNHGHVHDASCSH